MIGIVNIEPKIVNTAYMRMSSYYKGRVSWFQPLFDYDEVYCSKLFTFTEMPELPKHTVYGGSGISLERNLPVAIELEQYDYSIYPDCKVSYVWFSKGCDRNCPFCVVRQKEGYIHPVDPKNLNPQGEKIIVNDNNFFASPEWSNAIKWLKSKKQPISFDGGIDVRLLDIKQYEALNQFPKKAYQFKIAWDNPKEDIPAHIERALPYIKPYRFMCYVLIGYWSTPEEDLYRVEKLRSLKIDPFVMPYNKKDLYQKKFARWVNHKAIFKSVKWRDYGKY